MIYLIKGAFICEKTDLFGFFWDFDLVLMVLSVLNSFMNKFFKKGGDIQWL